jgi:hypothetical protein
MRRLMIYTPHQYHSGDQTEKNEMGGAGRGGACSMYRGGAYKVLVGKPDGKRPLGRPRLRWEDNIKMDLREVGWGHGLD